MLWQWQLVSLVRGVFRRWSSRCAVLTLSVAIALLGAPVVAAGAPQGGAAAPQDTAPAGDGAVPPLTGPQPQRDTLTAADEAPGSRDVRVSFTQNFISDRLPFDVPFNVTGSVVTSVKRLELSVYQVRSNVDLARLISDLQRTVNCVGQQPQGRLVSQSAATPSDTGAFSLFVNALDPQYYYAFCFVGVSPVPGADFNDDVRRILASLIPRLDNGGDITNAMLADVRSAMSGKIAEIGEGRPVRATIPPGNLFDPARPTDPRFGPLATALTDPFVNMEIQQRGHTNSVNEFVADVADARSGGSVRFTSELNAALAGVNRTLPTRASAVTGTASFDSAGFRFEDAKAALDNAVKAAAAGSEELKVLNGLVNDLQEVINAAQTYGLHYDRMHNAAAALINFVALEARVVTVTLGSSVLSADLARSAYVSMDAGIAYPWRLESMVFYAGTNIYFRPINKAAPLRYKGTFLHRFALTVGITTTVKDDSRRAQDLRNTEDNDTSNSLLLGAGIRVTPSLRVGGGVLVFKESDANPLIDQTSVAVTPYVSFTADVDVANLFRSLF